MAELADAHDSGSCARNGVEVQVLSSAPNRFLFWRVPPVDRDYGELDSKELRNAVRSVFSGIAESIGPMCPQIFLPLGRRRFQVGPEAGV